MNGTEMVKKQVLIDISKSYQARNVHKTNIHSKLE